MAKFVGTVMHGGTMYIRGEVGHLGKEVKVVRLDEEDRRLLRSLVEEFCGYFGFDPDETLDHEFSNLIPVSHSPYGTLYTY